MWVSESENPTAFVLMSLIYYKANNDDYTDNLSRPLTHFLRSHSSSHLQTTKEGLGHRNVANILESDNKVSFEVYLWNFTFTKNVL